MFFSIARTIAHDPGESEEQGQPLLHGRDRRDIAFNRSQVTEDFAIYMVDSKPRLPCSHPPFVCTYYLPEIGAHRTLLFSSSPWRGITVAMWATNFPGARLADWLERRARCAKVLDSIPILAMNLFSQSSHDNQQVISILNVGR
jgi:hypothetical protein